MVSLVVGGIGVMCLVGAVSVLVSGSTVIDVDGEKKGVVTKEDLLKKDYTLDVEVVRHAK